MTTDKILDWARRINDAGKAIGNDGKPLHEHTSTIVGLSALILEATPDQSRTPELHPESVCGSCKGENPGPWSAPNDLWNQIVGSPYGILCPNCFINLANEMGVTNVWDVAPRITPPDVQEAEPVADAEYTPVSEAHEAAIDEALGLTRMILRFPAELMATLRSEADAKDVVLAAHIRDRLSQPPSGDAEDARRYRWLRGEGFERGATIWVVEWKTGIPIVHTDLDERIDAMLARGDG